MIRLEAYQTRPQMVRVNRAINMLGISKATFYRYVWADKFHIIKRGKLSYVPTDEIEAFLDPKM